MDTTRYTVKLFKDGEIIDYLNTDDEVLAHTTSFELIEKYGNGNVWICDVFVEWMVGYK